MKFFVQPLELSSMKAILFAKIGPVGLQKRLHRDRRLLCSRQEGWVQGDILQVASGDGQTGQPVAVQLLNVSIEQKGLQPIILALLRAGIEEVQKKTAVEA
jgi:hypothetical protein